MKLGDDKNFKYCPIKKRYIFGEEDEESDEDFNPPP